jgi:Putative phage tail protein
MGGSSSVTIGYKYSLGMHMIPCHAIDEVQEIRVGDRVAWSGSVTDSTTLNIDEPLLFGGPKKEGGVVGPVDIEMGGENQTQNSYLANQLGANIPSFRGVLSIILNHVHVVAMSAYPKPWAFKVKRIPAKTFNPTKADIDGSANPVNIIYDLLTNRDYGLGYDSTAIDIASFTAASDQLYSENFGLSFTLTNQDSTEKLISDVMNHINGMFYTRNDNGQFTIKLVRDDYDPNTLPVYDEDSIIKMEEYQRPSYGELINEIVVVYKPKGQTEKDSVSVQDLAGIQVQQGIVSQTFNYIGIDNADVAGRVALRDLRQKSNPVAALKIVVNRRGFSLTLGDVFKFSWAKLGIETVISRIVNINYGNFDSGEIIISALEDVFGLPDASYISDQPSLFVDPIIDPVIIAVSQLRESAYWDVARSTTASELALYDDATVFYRAAAQKPPGAHINFEMHKEVGNNTYIKESEGGFCTTATLISELPKVGTSSTIALENINGSLASIETGTYAYIDDEKVAIRSIDVGASTITIDRAVIDTVPASHAPGSIIFFFEKNNSKNASELAVGSGSHTFRLLSQTGKGVFPVLSATDLTKTPTGRFSRPYRPANFKINNDSFPLNVSGSSISFVWVHRNRLQETASLIAYDGGGVTVEPGTTYNFEFRGENNVLLLDLVNDPGTSASISIAAEAALSGVTSLGAGRDLVQLDPVSQIVVADANIPRVGDTYTCTLDTERNSILNHQQTTHTCDRSGYGLRYGEYYGG